MKFVIESGYIVRLSNVKYREFCLSRIHGTPVTAASLGLTIPSADVTNWTAHDALKAVERLYGPRAAANVVKSWRETK